MCGPDAACWSWNESWTGCRAHWVHAVLPEHSGVPLVPVVQPGRGGVAMVRRRSTVRFRKGAPLRAGHGQVFAIDFEHDQFPWNESWTEPGFLAPRPTHRRPIIWSLRVPKTRRAIGLWL